MLTLHALTFDRVVPCAAELCAADLAELDAAGIADARRMLCDALPLCSWAEEARWHGKSIAIFGVRPLPGGDVGVPWMLTMVHMDTAQRRAVAKAAADAVARMRSEFSTLKNFVHARNARAIRFVQHLGFTVGSDPVGPGAAFLAFSWSRNV
jgi:hypothetical protein